MADVVGTAEIRIYENTNVTVKARIDRNDVGSIEEVSFKFLKDGEQFEEKTIPTSQGETSEGQLVLSHAVKAPTVPDDKSSYFLDYYYFYKIKNPDASTETLQNFPANRIQVFPRVAQLKVTDKDGKAFHDFEFMVEQNGELSDVRKTVFGATPNAKGESIPAGSCEFNLGLFAGFRIVPSPPYRMLEEVVGTGRKREIKGAVGFRAAFVAPQSGNVRQYVNDDVEYEGHTGIGHAVTIRVGGHPEDSQYLKSIANPEIHFRVTYGPVAGSSVAKSERNDKDHPTKVLNAGPSDTSVTIEEKEAGKKYQGKVKLVEGSGKFIVALGKAGGDECKVEISGSDKFLTDQYLPPDAQLQFQNWRRVHYELMVPDIMQDRILAPSQNENANGPDAEKSDPRRSLNLNPAIFRKLEVAGRQLFIEFVHDATHVFDAKAQSDRGTLTKGSFLELSNLKNSPIYILGGRNWREPPRGMNWLNKSPGKTLYINSCDGLLKWRTDTKDKQAGTTDFSGSLTQATGSLNVEEKFGGLYMPHSGYDGEEGITGITLVPDISKDDNVCKYVANLEISETRTDDQVQNEIYIGLEAEELEIGPVWIGFSRLSYPDLEILDKAAATENDDGKITLNEAKLNKKITLEFKLEDNSKGAQVEDDPYAGLTSGFNNQLDAFFKDLFKSGRAQLGTSRESNVFRLEMQHKTAGTNWVDRYDAALWAINKSYERTYNHELHRFDAKIDDSQSAKIKGFVDALLDDPARLIQVDGSIKVTVSGPTDAQHGEDDCFKAVKSKLQELFDAPEKKNFCYHPGLGADGMPRQMTMPLAEITDGSKCTVREWHFRLPEILQNGSTGPGKFVGPAKTRSQCPVKIEFSLQPHERSEGEVDGNLLAWVATGNLLSMILRAFHGVNDDASCDHGHGNDGMPGDCLKDSSSLCSACIAFGRSKDLSLI